MNGRMTRSVIRETMLDHMAENPGPGIYHRIMDPGHEVRFHAEDGKSSLDKCRILETMPEA